MRRELLIAAAGILCAGFVHAAQDALPKVDEIMDKYIAATGGRAAYEKRKNEVTTGTMDFTGKGIKGTMTAYSDASNNAYSVIEIEGIGKMEQGVYNGMAWESSALQGSRIREGAEKAEMLRDSTFNGELKWRELYPKAEVAGVEDIDGSPAYKVILTPADGKPQTLFFDKKSAYMVKRMVTVINPMGEIPMEMTLTNYRKLGDIVRPTKMTQKVMGQEFSITLWDVKTNVDIPKDRFEPPAEIKKLMNKDTAAPAVKQ
jgi:hypothetical protein